MSRLLIDTQKLIQVDKQEYLHDFIPSIFSTKLSISNSNILSLQNEVKGLW